MQLKQKLVASPADKPNRLASCYLPNPATGTLELFDGVQDSQWIRPPAFPSGANGLVSTLDDYLAFAQMTLNQGKYGSGRILSRLTVEASPPSIVMYALMNLVNRDGAQLLHGFCGQ
jgi:CubicO group peptidase (beta-lactamase class C family)